MKVSITINTKKDYDLDKYDAIVHIRPKDKSKSWYEETVECNLSPVVESRPKGKWIDKHATHYECSECGEWVNKESAHRYCTFCGAEMRGEEC